MRALACAGLASWQARGYLRHDYPVTGYLMTGYLVTVVAARGGQVVSAVERAPWHASPGGRSSRAGRAAQVSARSVATGANNKRISERHA
jgi:hypothetical protein